MSDGWQKKHVCGREGKIVGMGRHTLAFVGRLFFFISFLCSKNKLIIVRFFGLHTTSPQRHCVCDYYMNICLCL
jgi:hypothetical protein